MIESEKHLPCGSDSEESACNAGDPGLIPGSGRSPGEGNGNPLQYSCLENPNDRGAWQAIVHGVANSWTRLNDFTFFFRVWKLTTLDIIKDFCIVSSQIFSGWIFKCLRVSYPWMLSFQGRKGKINFVIYFYHSNFFLKKVGGKGNENNWLKLGFGDSLWFHFLTIFLYPTSLSKPQTGFVVLLVVTGFERSVHLHNSQWCLQWSAFRIPDEIWVG